MKRKLIFSSLFFAAAVLVLGVAKWMAFSPVRRWEAKAYSVIGHSEVDVVQWLGQPCYVVSAATLGGRSVDYPWKDMGFVPVPDRPVRNKVLLYWKLNVAIYVYVDETGIVEHVAVAGT